MLDTRYEKVHDAGAVHTRAVQIAVGVDTEGHRHVLAVEAADEESENSWETFLKGLKKRGLTGVQYVVSDSHPGLKRAIEKVLTTALWQRCAVHFLRNAADRNTRQADPACLDGLKRMWDYENADQARLALQAWIQRWGDEPGCDKLDTANSLSSGLKKTSRKPSRCIGCRTRIAAG